MDRSPDHSDAWKTQAPRSRDHQGDEGPEGRSARAGGTRCDGLSPGIALAGVPGPGRRPRPRSRRGPDVLELIDPPLEVLDPLDDRRGSVSFSSLNEPGPGETGSARSGAVGTGAGAASCRSDGGGTSPGTGIGPRPTAEVRARPARRRRSGFDPPEGEASDSGRRTAGGRLGPRVGGGHGHARPGRSRQRQGPRPRGGPRIRLPRSAGGPHGHLGSRAGRLALADDAQDDVRPRRDAIEPVDQVVAGPDRLAVEGDDAIPGTEPRPGGRRAGDHVADPRALAAGPAPGRTPPSPRASPRASDRPSPGEPAPAAPPCAGCERSSKPRPAAEEAGSGAAARARGRRASSRGGPPGRPDRRGHGPGAGRRSTTRRGSGWRSRSRCPARPSTRVPPRRPDARPLGRRRRSDAPGPVRSPATAGRPCRGSPARRGSGPASRRGR